MYCMFAASVPTACFYSGKACVTFVLFDFHLFSGISWYFYSTKLVASSDDRIYTIPLMGNKVSTYDGSPCDRRSGNTSQVRGLSALLRHVKSRRYSAHFVFLVFRVGSVADKGDVSM